MRYPSSAGFSFYSELFFLDLEPKYPNATFMVEKYVLRSQAVIDRTKHVFLPSRVELNSVWTHNFLPKQGYEKQRLPQTTGVIFHYRKCRPEWRNKEGKCQPNHPFVEDYTLRRVVEQRNNKMTALRKHIFQLNITSTG